MPAEAENRTCSTDVEHEIERKNRAREESASAPGNELRGDAAPCTNGFAMPLRTPYARCPLCDSDAIAEHRLADCTAHPLYDPRLPPVMRWMICGACAHVFVDGAFTDEALAILFSRTNANQFPQWCGDHGAQLVHARIVERVLRHRSELGGRWLDVGFGNGLLMAAADEFGFHAVGLDLRRRSVDAMRALGFEAHAIALEAFDAPPFDVLSMADALEHMTFPKQTLVGARRLIVDGGLLFLSMPNSDSFAWRSRDALDANPYWGELEHLHNFGRKRLFSLLRECGFAPKSYAVNERYLVGMEIVAEKLRDLPA